MQCLALWFKDRQTPVGSGFMGSTVVRKQAPGDGCRRCAGGEAPIPQGLFRPCQLIQVQRETARPVLALVARDGWWRGKWEVVG